MNDPVAVDLDGKHGQVLDRAYAEAMGLTILDDEPTHAHGRLRGVFRLDGRRLKPKVRVRPATGGAGAKPSARQPRQPRAAATVPTTTDADSTPAAGTADGKAVEKPEEATE